MRSRPSFSRVPEEGGVASGPTSVAPCDDGGVAGVEHGEQLLDQRLDGPAESSAGLLGGPLAVVLEVGLVAAERIEVLVAPSPWSLRT
jgi:hypothetical protein